MRVRKWCEVWVIVDAEEDDTDADRVWKDSSANEDSKQQPTGTASDKASLLEGAQSSS